jgi:hypothetical protein
VLVALLTMSRSSTCTAQGGKTLVNKNPDFTNILKVGSELYAVQQSESPNPVGVQVLALNQDTVSRSVVAALPLPRG